jgi:hypothetical protein
MLDFAGCYIGQETVARLITYQGVKQHLWGLILDGYVDPGTTIILDGQKVCLIPWGSFIITVIVIYSFSSLLVAMISCTISHLNV